LWEINSKKKKLQNHKLLKGKEVFKQVFQGVNEDKKSRKNIIFSGVILLSIENMLFTFYRKKNLTNI